MMLTDMDEILHQLTNEYDDSYDAQLLWLWLSEDASRRNGEVFMAGKQLLRLENERTGERLRLRVQKRAQMYPRPDAFVTCRCQRSKQDYLLEMIRDSLIRRY
jgi:hypothetical protein